MVAFVLRSTVRLEKAAAVKAFLFRRNVSYSRSLSQYCLDTVRRHDYENYLCCLLLRPGARKTALAVRAFNAELAQIKDAVSNPSIGMMRIQFWKDALDKIYQGCPPQQPIALELFKVIQCHKLSKHWFSRLIESREKSLHNVQFQIISDVEQYAEESVSSIFYLLLQANGINNMSCDHAASHLGKCQGILNMIRSIPYNASKRKVDIPIQELIKHNISQEDIIRGRQSKNVTDMIYEIASVANQHLQMSRSLKDKIPKNVKSVFLAACVCDDYLKRLQREDFHIFSSKLTLRNNKLPLVLWWKKFCNKY